MLASEYLPSRPGYVFTSPLRRQVALPEPELLDGLKVRGLDFT
jgi:hypothetical protein